MADYLIVANQTLGGEHLLDAVRERMEKGPSRFHILVPATHSQDWIYRRRAYHLRADSLGGDVLAVAPASDEEGRRRARQSLEEGLEQLRALGAEADGEIGDPHPMSAIDKVLRKRSFDEVILSTLPRGRSRWFGLDLPHRVERRFGVPVTHIVAPADVASE